MSKRTNRRESLPDVLKEIGRLSFNRSHRLGNGSYGSVYKGIFQIDVAVKRIDKNDFKEMETIVMEKIEPHPNVLQYYWTEEDADFMWVWLLLM